MAVPNNSAPMPTVPSAFFAIRLWHLFLMVGTCAFAFALWRVWPNALSVSIPAFWIGVIFAQVGVSVRSRFWPLRAMLGVARGVGLLVMYVSAVVGCVSAFAVAIGGIGYFLLSMRR